MSQIKVTNLTFCYDGSYDNIFENTSFQIDTDWKLGFIGRNGRGKTTFMNLLTGKYEYKGSINAYVYFDYFPYDIKDKNEDTLYCIKEAVGEFEDWKLMTELSKLEVSADVLYRPFLTLSNGEQTKVMLAALFIKENNFLLIDEPTNHLDIKGRELLADYLAAKKSFILVSHDRAFLDKCIDHVLSINKCNIEVQKGNYTTWKNNKDMQDRFELEKNEVLKKDIKRLKESAKRSEKWSDIVEAEKIGTHQADRGRVGHLAAKAMKRSKNIEKRQLDAIDEKKKLLKNVDILNSLKIPAMDFPKKEFVFADNLSLSYGSKKVFSNLSFDVIKGDRVAVSGKNGSGKSSLLKLLAGREFDGNNGFSYTGLYKIASGLKISYVSQDTSFLKGNLTEFANENNLDLTLFMTILRYFDFSRVQFEKDIESYSMGQKKKILMAKSLAEPAHLYIWDEPLNYVDVLSRIQIEEVVLKFAPTMIFVEHDRFFSDNIATKVIEI